MTKISILPFIVLAGMLSGGNAEIKCSDFTKQEKCKNEPGCKWRVGYGCIPKKNQRENTDSYVVSLETDSDYDNEGADVERINPNNQDLLAEYTDCFDFLTESECTSRKPRCRWFDSAKCGPSLSGRPVDVDYGESSAWKQRIIMKYLR
jgi:hypothetical protein